jgi:methylmalonyl-CoA epimerase
MNASSLQKTLGPLVLGVDHLAIAVADLEKAIQWYCDALGFQLNERRHTQGENTSMASAVLTCGNAMIVLVQGQEPNSQVSRFIQHMGAGVCHVAFAVSDLDEAIRCVEAASGAVDTPKIEDAGIRQVFLRHDSDSGVRIELIERKGGRFSDKSVEKLFRAFEEKNLF